MEWRSAAVFLHIIPVILLQRFGRVPGSTTLFLRTPLSGNLRGRGIAGRLLVWAVGLLSVWHF